MPVPMSCVIVDDSDVVRKVIRTILEGIDLKVIEAASVEKARQLCQTKLPDAVVIDWHIPGEAPLELIAELRAEAPSSKLKIVYMMTNLEPADIAKAKAAGADEVLAKPFHRVQLEAKLLGLLTPKRDAVPDYTPDKPLMRAGIPVKLPTLRKPEMAAK